MKRLIEFIIILTFAIAMWGCGKNEAFVPYCVTTNGWRYLPVNNSCPYKTDSDLIAPCGGSGILCVNPNPAWVK